MRRLSRYEAYSLLGISEDSSLKDIKRAYANKLKQYHPEENAQEFSIIQEAYNVAVECINNKEDGSLELYNLIIDDQEKENSIITSLTSEQLDLLDNMSEDFMEIDTLSLEKYIPHLTNQNFRSEYYRNLSLYIIHFDYYINKCIWQKHRTLKQTLVEEEFLIKLMHKVLAPLHVDIKHPFNGNKGPNKNNTDVDIFNTLDNKIKYENINVRLDVAVDELLEQINQDRKNGKLNKTKPQFTSMNEIKNLVNALKNKDMNFTLFNIWLKEFYNMGLVSKEKYMRLFTFTEELIPKENNIENPYFFKIVDFYLMNEMRESILSKNENSLKYLLHENNKCIYDSHSNYYNNIQEIVNIDKKMQKKWKFFIGIVGIFMIMFVGSINTNNTGAAFITLLLESIYVFTFISKVRKLERKKKLCKNELDEYFSNQAI